MQPRRAWRRAAARVASGLPLESPASVSSVPAALPAVNHAKHKNHRIIPNNSITNRQCRMEQHRYKYCE